MNYSVDDILQQATQTSSPNQKITLSGVELMAMDFPEPVWLVENILPAGFAILAGPPKKGKSWLALELAHAICSGGEFLGAKVNAGRVLYLALEDGPKRFKNRMEKQGWSQTALGNIEIIFGRKFHEMFSGKDGLKKFVDFLDQNNYVLVVIDTIARAFNIRDWNDGALVTMTLSPLQELATEKMFTILAIDHHNKLKSLDLVLDLAGSVSKSGVADTLIGLYREQGKSGARLVITGRDIEDVTFDIEFDAFTGAWQVIDLYKKLTPQQQQLLETIQNLGGEASLSELVRILGGDKGNLYRRLASLEQLGMVLRAKGLWKIT